MATAAPADRARQAYLAALLDLDARRARTVVAEAVSGGMAVADVYTRVLGPALEEIGHRWAMDEVTIAREHFATNVTLSLLPLTPGARTPPTDGRLAVVSGTPDEQHVVGVQMVTDLLERDGWEVICLGASTPADELVELATLECPDLVALSTATAGRLPGLAEVLRRLDVLRPRPLIAVGGAVFTADGAAFAREAGADLVTSDICAFLETVRARIPAVRG